MSEKYQALLDEQRVVRVEYLAVRARYPRLHGKNAIKSYHGFGGTIELARLTTDAGVSGWASLLEPVAKARQAEALVLGKPLGSLIHADEGIMDPALQSFDLALHDLTGRVLGIPVSKMIAPEPVSHVRVYDGAIYMNDIIPEEHPAGLEQVLRDCEADYALGHRSMKIKIGRSHMWMPHDEGLARDIEVVRAIHKAFPDVTLLVDANDGYTLEDCFAFLEGIKDVPLYWFEEPFREEPGKNAALKAYLRQHCPQTKIADGESMTDIPLLMSLADQNVLDVWMPDVCEYGFTKWRKLLKEIVPKGYLSSPHAWGQVLKMHYCAHLAAAYPQHIPYVEGVLGETEGVDYCGYELRGGVMHVPDRPGFGMELQWAEPIK